MAWQFIVTDLNHIPMGEILNAPDRSVTKALSRMDTATLRVEDTNPLADRLLACDGRIKGYRNGVLEFHGPIISAEDSVGTDGKTIAVNAMMGWELTKRLAGRTSLGAQFPTATDRALIIKSLIVAANADWGTGIHTGLSPISSGSTITYTAGPYRPISEIINELSASTDGFDWRILPNESYSYGSGAATSDKYGSFTAAPVLGTTRANAIFEHGPGTRNNIASYNHTVSRDTQATRVWSFGPNGAGDTANPPISRSDGTMQGKWGLIEDIAQSDLSDAALRGKLLDEHISVRAKPRQLIKFQPTINSGVRYGTDYGVGDLVTARAIRNGVTRFNAVFRIWGVQFDIDSNGVETITLTLADS